MKPSVRRGVECVLVLFLAGGFAQLDRARAGNTGAPALIWGTAYQSFIGKQPTIVASTIRTFAQTHKDFRRSTTSTTPGRYAGIMGDFIGPDGKPVFASTGYRVVSAWRDAAGNTVMKPRSYIVGRTGDVAGSLATTVGGTVESSSTVSEWYRDVANVNTAKRVNFELAKQNALYVFDGSLDNATGTRSVDYTAEMTYDFVHETGKNWYIDVGTNAEAWVYVDDRLVIDGGGLGGVSFTITNGQVIPSETCDASITVVGAAIQSGNTPCPVTTRVKVGDKTLEPFGAFTSHTAANVNDNKNPRTASLGTGLAPGTKISVTGQSFTPSGSKFNSYITVDSSSGSAAVKVLRNGDPVPDIKPFEKQDSVKTFLSPYMDLKSGRMTLQANQVIYLFELGTTSLNSAAADFQDLVALVTLTRPTTTTPSTTTTNYSAAPDMKQRIDLDRLDWLEDRGSHRIRIFFANRTGASSNLRVETNVTTLNLVNSKAMLEQD